MKEKIQPSEFLSKSKVFFVGSPTDATVLIAINPRYQDQPKTLSWWDTVKERVKEVKSINLGEESVLQMMDVQDQSYVFVPLSLTLYNNVVKNRLPGKREFKTEGEMIKAFEETMQFE